jgi:RNA polymerase sigma factor (sigma-70 family)
VAATAQIRPVRIESGVRCNRTGPADEDRGVDSAASPAVAIGHRLSSDPDAINDAYTTLGPMVLNYLRRLVPASDAEDVLQRTFVEVWRSRDRYDPNRSLEGWVLGIARKRAIDHLRKRHHDVVPLDEMRGVAGDDGRVLAERYERATLVRSALTQLPEEQKQVLALVYFGERTQSEAAEHLGVPLGTVKARVFRGLRRLGSLLDEEAKS